MSTVTEISSWNKSYSSSKSLHSNCSVFSALFDLFRPVSCCVRVFGCVCLWCCVVLFCIHSHVFACVFYPGVLSCVGPSVVSLSCVCCVSVCGCVVVRPVSVLVLGLCLCVGMRVCVCLLVRVRVPLPGLCLCVGVRVCVPPRVRFAFLQILCLRLLRLLRVSTDRWGDLAPRGPQAMLLCLFIINLFWA